MKEKRRVDQWLVDLGMADSREKAKALVMAGQVLAGTRRVDKPGENLDRTAAAALTLKAGATLRYVGRGGLKLEKALDTFGVDPHGKLVLDIGASTGGFTDCVLQRGATRVFAVDVGQNQLDWKIRNDPRVIVMDKTNIRYLENLPALPTVQTNAPATAEEEPSKNGSAAGEKENGVEVAPPLAELVVIDVSFISLKLVLPAARRLSLPDAPILALVKPQFEAGREQVGKGGIIKDPAVHRAVLKDLIEWCSEHRFVIRGLINSPILGTEGNREFLAYLLNDDEAGERTLTDPQLLIDEVMASTPEN